MNLDREFHVHRKMREKYGFEHRVFSLRGNVVFPDLQACRLFASRINSVRRTESHPDLAVHTSDIYAMGLIEEIMHYLITVYREQVDSRFGSRLRERLLQRFSERDLDALLARFVEEFPPSTVYNGQVSPEQFLDSSVEGVPGRDIALEEMLILHLENVNPAYTFYNELFDDTALSESSAYPVVIEEMRQFFSELPPFAPEGKTLLETLQAPMRAYPHSLQGQLQYIRERWGSVAGRFLYRLLRGVDFLEEEHALRAAPGPGEPETYVYSYGEAEAGTSERFSPDRYWMPNVVLLAKTSLVWLDQLSRAYGKSISRLDQVPDAELDTIASRGFTGLWLIGLWERSPASRRIKNLCGNPEAEASAYSLYDYTIAESLGGWEALAELRDRCEARGIRLASDMVPNHSGIDSKWIHEHPEWFLQLEYCPYPSYSFAGENLSSVPGVGIYLEDHYYERSDAAVVFKRVDAGGERYVYHGNDGTSMPWNDTAQLDYLNPEVREAVIGTILHVARNFSIIRFDAAMTLARKHIQRLWYPTPGSGGAIPSRAEHGLSQEEFDRLMPKEFWREVVERVAEEVPDTLLLAEAFWMMESYFVRSLGMHRVYNSAFMNMLKNEENAKYRRTIKNTLEFDPQILKRFVNFMNNPDEETAVAQFGKGDKYFGVATLMLTMPGLPMFGHGQVEGFAEKYGMEYSRAYWNEEPDEQLIERHNRELAPLARRRSLFAEAEEFELYDLHVHHGGVAESVFAYSNKTGDARALVLYNNAYEEVNGWIHTSSPVNRPAYDSPVTRSVGEALGLSNSDDTFMLAYEQHSGLWYIRNCAELHERGLAVHLNGYETQVFIDIRQVQDSDDGHYRRLAAELDGVGVRDIDAALKELFLRPLHEHFDELVGSPVFARVMAVYREKRPLSQADRATLYSEYVRFADTVSEFTGLSGTPEAAARRFVRLLAALEAFLELETHHFDGHPEGVSAARSFMYPPSIAEDSTFEALLGYVLLEPLSEFGDLPARPEAPGLSYGAGSLVTDLMLEYRWEKLCGGQNTRLRREVSTALMLAHWFVRDYTVGEVLYAALQDFYLSDFVGVNQWEGVTWFDRDSMAALFWWLAATAMLDSIADEADLLVARGDVALRYHSQDDSAVSPGPEQSSSPTGGDSAPDVTAASSRRAGSADVPPQRERAASPDKPAHHEPSASPSPSVPEDV
ncbi:MAG: alpha-amylase family glycosyl hydrolase, partial [Spirochaetia bacterium]